MPEPAQTVGPNLPEFEPNKVYLLSGKTLTTIMKQIKRETPKITVNGGLKIDNINDEGTFLSVDVNALSNAVAPGNGPLGSLALQVCIGGVTKTVTFIVQGTPV